VGSWAKVGVYGVNCSSADWPAYDRLFTWLLGDDSSVVGGGCACGADENPPLLGVNGDVCTACDEAVNGRSGGSGGGACIAAAADAAAAFC